MLIRRKQFVSIFLIMIFMTSLLASNTTNIESTEPFFTLVAKTNGGGIRPDYLNMLKQHLARIGINLDVYVLDWPTFVGELIVFRDFDICFVGIGSESADPDMTGVYNENGSLNLFGYHTSMDWDEDKGTGLNEWYMKQGTLMMPPDSPERVQHYWDWQQYLMDKICPLKPALTPEIWVCTWSNLYGYDFKKGTVQSWGHMGWDGAHLGQTSTNEFVEARAEWMDLNPLFQDDSDSALISKAIMDPLIWYDCDLSVRPHLATSWMMINDTHARISLREGIKWQTDPDGLFPNENFDAEDVYFTIYAWKHVSDETSSWAWVKDIEVLDQWTLDIFIDGDPSTPENEPYAPFLPSLKVLMLPEHYLNQTQLADGVTPDIHHSSWQKFTVDCFGTGLFVLDDFVEGVETVLTLNDDCWFLDPLVVKSDMDFENRFGNFSSGLDTWRIKIITYYPSALLEFEIGHLDIIGVTDMHGKITQFSQDPDFDLQTKTKFRLSFYGYNMREDRIPIGSRELCPNDPSMTIGLAVRKAISYAIDRNEINQILHGGLYEHTYHPIYDALGIWCNPNIIRYEYDLDKAREYLVIAGYDIGYTPTDETYLDFLSIISILCIVTVTFSFQKKRKK